MASYISKYFYGKRYSQDDLIPIVVLVLGTSGGKAKKQYVEETIYDLLQIEFTKDFYQVRVANASVPRWKHYIAWARERAKQNHGFIKSAKFARRGTWELTPEGTVFFNQLVEVINNTKNDQT